MILKCVADYVMKRSGGRDRMRLGVLADGDTIKLPSFLPLMLPLVGHHYLTGEHSLGSNDD